MLSGEPWGAFPRLIKQDAAIGHYPNINGAGESIAIIDRGRVVVSGPLKDVKRAMFICGVFISVLTGIVKGLPLLLKAIAP